MELRINPRAASLLLGLCATYVAGRSGKNCRAELSVGAGKKQVVLHNDGGATPAGGSLTLYVHPWVGAGKSVAEAVARAIGAELSLDKDPARATLIWQGSE